MCKQLIGLSCAALLVMVGCERGELSPVDIKLDESGGYTEIGADTATPAASSKTEANAAAAEARPLYYTVQDERTIFEVASKFNIDPYNLAELNGVKPPYYKVKRGQILQLPAETPQDAAADDMMAQYEQAEKAKEKNELDEEFAGVMKSKGRASSIPSSKVGGVGFNEQEELLSSPKVTKSATGVSKVKPTAAAPGKMIRPVDGKVISRFGDVKDGISNDGINIKAALGTPVKAAADGEVIYAGNKLEEFGNTVILQHDNDLITSYAHLNEMKVKSGAAVNAGDIIGTVGKTGEAVGGPQLHFEVLKNKTPVDPEKYFGGARSKAAGRPINQQRTQ
ncbi:MAG: M23 family metallopeptidase [Holosporaceae bacterium]|nr:M23 family metallopeptidase [Holosporaceae bacterium]